jgi:hypothetical protein
MNDLQSNVSQGYSEKFVEIYSSQIVALLDLYDGVRLGQMTSYDTPLLTAMAKDTQHGSDDFKIIGSEPYRTP